MASGISLARNASLLTKTGSFPSPIFGRINTKLREPSFPPFLPGPPPPGAGPYS